MAVSPKKNAVGAEKPATKPQADAVQAVGGILEPKDRNRRERRPMPGVDGHEITRTGMVWSAEHDEVWDVDQWPNIWLLVGDDVVRVNTVAAVAMIWLDAAQRAEIRAKLPGSSRHDDREVLALAKEVRVSKHAVALVTSRTDEELAGWATVEHKSDADGEIGRVEAAEVEEYWAVLKEFYRAPSRGGNTSALHLHFLRIGGEKYSFFARGSKKWVYKGDKVSFAYRMTPEGYRNVVRSSVVTFDKDGRPVTRGDRRWKPVLRSAPQRAPCSRRERRD